MLCVFSVRKVHSLQFQMRSSQRKRKLGEGLLPRNQRRKVVSHDCDTYLQKLHTLMIASTRWREWPPTPPTQHVPAERNARPHEFLLVRQRRRPHQDRAKHRTSHLSWQTSCMGPTCAWPGRWLEMPAGRLGVSRISQIHTSKPAGRGLHGRGLGLQYQD